MIKAKEIFNKAPFIHELGIELIHLESGICEAQIQIQPKHLQQDGYVHAGVQATLADHCAGGAAGTMLAPDQTILSIEFKVNFLRPAIGQMLKCRSQVLKPGKTIFVAESEVFIVKDSQEKLVSKATVSLAIMKIEEMKLSI